MEKVKKNLDFTEGKVFLKIVLFILPIIATNLLQVLYNAADMMVVSLSSEPNAVGAIGTTGAFINLIVNVFIGFSVGANVVVAREIGAKDQSRVQKAVHTSLLMAVAFGFVGMGIGLLVSRPVLSFMGNTGSLLELAVAYTYIYFCGVPFLALTNYLIAIFRAKGDAKTPLVVLTSTGLLNVALNLFFVLVTGMSVEGVAIATGISNVVSFILLLWKLHRDRDDTKFSFRKLKMDWNAFRDIVVNGLPAGIQGALFSLSNMLIQSSIVQVNNAVVPPDSEYQPIVNGSAAAGNLENFIYMGMNAVYQGAITFTSQNMGADKPERVKRIMYACFGIVTMVGVVMSATVMLLSKPLLALYGVVDGAEGSLEWYAMNAALTRFAYISGTYFLCGVMDVCTGVLRGMGRAIVSTCISLVGACLFRVVWLSTVFAMIPTLDVIFVSYPVSWIITAGVAFAFIQVLLHRILKAKGGQSLQPLQEEKLPA